MMNQTSTNTMRRLANVVILAVALPLVALVPVFVASTLLPPSPSDSTTGELNVSSNETNTPEVIEIVIETVMTSDNGPVDSTSVFGFDFLQDADIITITLDDPQNTNRSSSDLDSNCSFYLVLDAHENSDSETFTGYIKVSEEDDVNLTDCSLHLTDPTDE